MITLEQVRLIVGVNKPFDSGRMFLQGSRLKDNGNTMTVTYDVKAVPYTVFQELGTKFFEGNKGFIGVNTVNEINEVATYQSAGMTKELTSFKDLSRSRSTMISNGLIQEVKSYRSVGG